MSSKTHAKSPCQVVQDLLVPELKAMKVSIDSLKAEMKLGEEQLDQSMRLRDEKLDQSIRLGKRKNRSHHLLSGRTL